MKIYPIGLQRESLMGLLLTRDCELWTVCKRQKWTVQYLEDIILENNSDDIGIGMQLEIIKLGEK